MPWRVGVLCSEIDPAYEAIFNGSWQPHSQATYTAIHRVALKVSFKVRTGFGAFALTGYSRSFARCY